MNQDNDRFLLLKLLFPTTTVLLSMWKEKRQAEKRRKWERMMEKPFRSFITRISPLLILITLLVAICTGH